MRFRQAKKEDVSKMFEILKMNGSKYPKKLAFQELNEMFSKSPLKPTYIIAEDKKEILGFGGFMPLVIDTMIFGMFWLRVNPKYKGRGVGSGLVNERIRIIKNLKRFNPKMILISTKIPNFAKKFGFKKLTSKYDGNYLLMSLNLN